MTKKSMNAETTARKADEQMSHSLLTKMKQRQRKLNLAELELLANWFAISNMGNDILYKITGDEIVYRILVLQERDVKMNLRTELDVLTNSLAGKYNNYMSEIQFELETNDPKEAEEFKHDAERDSWFKSLRKMSLEKISKTWPDMAPLLLWLATNGGQG